MQDSARKARPQVSVSFLMLTAVVCGALVMVIEVLGSRVIGPFFGVSLFVWTALISVAMAALALGYVLGGALSDRHPSPDVLYGLLAVAALAVLAIPLLRAPVLAISQPLGLRAGSLAAATILFGPSLTLLGMVSPYVVRLAAREMHRIGRTVGGFYAISTLGSVAGTVATGFWLIAFLGVERIFQWVGIVLLALSATYFVVMRRRWAALALLFPAFVIVPPAPVQVKTLQDGTRVSVLERVDSRYGQIKVVEYRGNLGAVRELWIDGLIQGGVDPATGLSVYEYVYALDGLPRALAPDGKRALVIGLGAGILPRAYASAGIEVDIVDIDPDVVDLARRHFGLPDGGALHIADARQFLADTPRRYDYLLLDVYNGDVTPVHLLSREAVRLLAERLAPGGVVGINLAGTVAGDTYITASVVRTLEAVFDRVELYPLFDWRRGGTSGNIAVIAYQGERRSPPSPVLPPGVNPGVAADVQRALREPFRFPESTRAIVLTDDYNPADVLDSAYREHVRKLILRHLDWDILLG